jgi:hypothetical protein
LKPLLDDPKIQSGVMEYWSFGVMGENRTEAYKPCFRAHRDMIIFSVKVIGQKQIQGGVCKLF